MQRKMETAPVSGTSARYVYSDKIKDRRRSLFPNEKPNDNSDLDHMSPLSSDSECGGNEGIENDKIDVIKNSSTKYIRDMLSTPKSNNYPPSEQSMSPLYLSPYTQHDTILSLSISPTKQLKTPNDSSVVNSDEIPKLSRKSTVKDDPRTSSTSLTQPKLSKVRTSLFPDIEVTLTPKQFYPKSDICKSTEYKTTKPQDSKKIMKKYYPKNKRQPGQINAGVRHKIRKPKERKIENKVHNISLEFARLKNSKDTIVEPELKEYLKDLQDLKETKETKLIQHNIPDKSSNLKRPLNETNDINTKKPKLDASIDYEDSTFDDEEVENLPNIDAIIDTLNETVEEDKENNLNIAEDMLLSPTSEMCNMTSVMKIDSPKKTKNLNLVFQNMAENQEVEQNEKTEAPKLFPIFYPNQKTAGKRVKDNFQMDELNNRRKRLKVSSSQMLLDAGQKRFGLTECAECDYVYHAADPKDEKMHEDRHNAISVLRFTGWKNERVLENLPNGGRIIEILPGDSKIWIEKAKKIIEVINRKMGYYDMTMDLNSSKVLLYIMNRQVIGCLVADIKTKGYKLLPSDTEIDMCSNEDYPIECGVSRLWVFPQARRKGVATKLMDILKVHFMKDHQLKNSDIAFSAPTTEGKLFATKYFQTPNFLTYFD